MEKNDVRRIVREEIVKALRILEAESEAKPHESGDFERIVLGVLSGAVNRAVKEVTESGNGDHPECSQCNARWGKELHERWCSRGA